MNHELIQIIDQIGREKGIAKEILIEAIESAVFSASRKKLGTVGNIKVQFNCETGELELLSLKKVVKEIANAKLEISLKEAKEINPKVKAGDELEISLDITEFGRIAAQTAKQVIVQKVREAEREVIYQDYKNRRGELVNGIVQREEHGDLIVDLGKTEGILPRREQIQKEHYRSKERLRAYILDVRKTTRGPQIILSRTHPGMLIRLFEMEVPEIYEGIVEIKGAAREPGERAKITVISSDSEVDPVGACVGVKGSRVQSIVRELKGERIDIIRWTEDISEFVKNALSPAAISDVNIKKDERSIEVIVADDQLSLAIGKRGQNVRLAARLTGWKLDIINETEVKLKRIGVLKGIAKVIKTLTALTGVGDKMAELLVEHNYNTIKKIADAKIEDISTIPGIGQKKAEKLIATAKKFLKSKKDE